MPEESQDRLRVLVKICQLYYEDGLNQQEIAKRLGISRPHVSRMLTAARNEGIVRISIQNPFSAEQELEKLLIHKFGIQDALVIDSTDTVSGQLYALLGRACSPLLESILKNGDTVGVMAGRSVGSAAEELEFFGVEGLRFVPLVGGWGSDGEAYHANANAKAFANKMKAKYSILHAPAMVSNAETGMLLRGEPEIASVLTLAQSSRLAVISIGEVSEQATMVTSGSFPSDEMSELRAMGAAANLCTSFLDRDGNVLDFPGKGRMIGLTAQELRGIPTVIGLAGGKNKAEAIHAALQGKWIDILVTDTAAAREILASY